jgi:hypothetical protein
MSDYNFYNTQKSEFSVNHKLWNTFKNIKPLYYTNGGYYEKIICWSLPDDIDSGEISALLLLLFNNITEEDIKELDISNKVWRHFIGLFNRTYFEEGDDLFSDNDVSMAYKRPFGNSNIMGDVAEMMDYDIDFIEMNPHLLVDKDNEYYEEYMELDKKIDGDKINEKEFFDNFYLVMIEIIQKYDFKFTNYHLIRDNEFSYNNYTESQGENILNISRTIFVPHISEFRDEIIDSILED